MLQTYNIDNAKIKKLFRFKDLLDVCDEYGENRETDTPWVISVLTLKGIEMKTLSNMSSRLHAMAAAKRQKGATMIEYVLLAALIGVIVAGFIPALTTAISGAFTTIATAINP